MSECSLCRQKYRELNATNHCWICERQFRLAANGDPAAVLYVEGNQAERKREFDVALDRALADMRWESEIKPHVDA